MNNIAENNKLIRNFMGLQPTLNKPYFYSYRDGVFFSSNGTLEEVSKSMDEYVKYSTDWNWLMEVVQKINLHIVASTDLAKNIERGLINANIERVYTSCVNYIKWYNQQSK